MFGSKASDLQHFSLVSLASELQQCLGLQFLDYNNVWVLIV